MSNIVMEAHAFLPKESVGFFCYMLFAAVLCAGNKPVKIALIQTVLNHTVLLKFAFRKGFCDCGSNLAFVLQNVRIVKLQERIQLGSPICHCHRDMLSCLSCGIIKLHGDNLVKLLHFTLG